MGQVGWEGVSGVRTLFEPHSDRLSSLHSPAEEAFERFELFPGVPTHTQPQNRPGHGGNALQAAGLIQTVKRIGAVIKEVGIDHVV